MSVKRRSVHFCPAKWPNGGCRTPSSSSTSSLTRQLESSARRIFATSTAIIGSKALKRWRDATRKTIRARLTDPQLSSTFSKDIRDPMAAQYSFVMKGLTKAFPGQKPILNSIHLQFYQDAKIGIVGPNGSGKSTLMKIMAGRDKEFTGEAGPGDGITVGYHRQEPQPE